MEFRIRNLTEENANLKESSHNMKSELKNQL